MKNVRTQSVIKKINILFRTTVVVVLVCMFIFYVHTFRSMQKEKQKYVNNVADNLVQSTNDTASATILLAETISNTSYTKTLLTDENSLLMSESRQALNKLTDRLVKSSSHVKMILLINNDEKVFCFNLYDYFLANKLDRKYGIFTVETDVDGFSGVLELDDSTEKYYIYSQPVYDNYFDEETQHKIGSCLVICSVDSLNNACENAYISKNAVFLILDQDDLILASNRTDGDKVGLMSDDALYSSYQIPQTGWTLFCSVPRMEFYRDLFPMHYMLIIFIVIIAAVFYILIFQIRSGLIQPLDNTVKFLMQAPNEVLHGRLEEEGSYEIRVLAANINQMLNNLNELNHKIFQNQTHMYENELSKSRAQLQALQLQINPHFLYNTLNCIQGLACQKKFQDICTVVADLSYILRYSLQEGNLSSVKEEILCIERYLQIVSFRFSGRFRFKILVDDAVGDYLMPRFLLQPLVENAISHGLKECPEGTLELSITHKNSVLHLECSDDGVGIAPERLLALRRALAEVSADKKTQAASEFGIGLINVQKRIKILYGETYGLSVDSVPQGGTTVCVEFPVQEYTPK